MTVSTASVKLMYKMSNLPPGHTFDDVRKREEEFKEWYTNITARTVTEAELEEMATVSCTSVHQMKAALAAIGVTVV